MKPLEYLTSRESATRVALAAVSGVMWILAFPRFDLWPLCFVGFVPLLVATERATLRETWFLASLAGTIFQAGTCSWFGYMAEKFMGAAPPLSWGVWLALAFWAGQPIALSFVLHRLLQRTTSLPSFLSLPIATVLVWPVFPNLFFYTLGTGLWSAPAALQPTEWVGPYGLDALVMVSNAALFEVLRMRARPIHRIGVAASFAAVAAWLVAGALSLSSWDARVASWQSKRIGLVQPMRESSFKQLPPEPGYTRDRPVEMEMTARLKEAGADLVIWPEGHLYGTMWKPSRALAFQEQARQLDLDVLIHDKGPDPELGPKRQRNSSVLYRKSGAPPEHYHKRVLIPFGEYYPYVGYSDWWKKTLKLRPSLWPGERAVTFDVAGMRLEPLICYEILFGRHVGRSVGPDAAGKVIVAQSNDGWYGPSSASAHHRAATVLRAVENRVPIIHSLNSGESTVIDPTGRERFVAPNWVRGEYVVDMPHDPSSGGSFYSAHAGWLVVAVRVGALLFLVSFFAFQRRRRSAAAL